MKHQDYIYLKEDYYNNPKETFKFIYNLIKKFYKKKINSILDLGCARGEWLYYIKKKTNIKNLIGVDYSRNLINDAKKKLNYYNIKFYLGSAEKIKIKKKFDIIIASGLISYFDSVDKFIKKSLIHLKKNGLFIILDNFNPYDVDVIVKYRNNKFSKKFEKGWNLHSIKTIKHIINKNSSKLIQIKKFNLSFDLKKTDDPCRSWHTKIKKKKVYTNGLSQIYNIHALVIKK
jgi:ubiquinone/menaquinone biosynthesis C-methylase UbiE